MKAFKRIIPISLAALFSFLLLCTIKDDNGSLVSTGPHSNTIDTTTSGTKPVILLTPDSSYIGIRDTLSVTVNVMQDSLLMLPLTNTRIYILANRGWLSAESLTTDSHGRATFKIMDTIKSTIKLLVICKSAEQTLSVSVTNNPDAIQKLISILPSRTILKADGKDSCTIAVTVKDTNNNPVVGQCIQFITSAGLIIGTSTGCSGTGQSATDSRGVARANLTSSNVNDTAFVTAYLVTNKSQIVQTKVAFNGVSILLHADSTNLTPNATTTITAILVNGSNETVASSHISFAVKKGTSSNLSIVSADTITNLSGSAQCVILGKTLGADSIIVNATGATKQTLCISVTNTTVKNTQLISILPSRTILKADGKDSCTIAVTLKDTNNNPVVGQCIQFVSSTGMIIGTSTGCSGTGQSATDSRGVARASLTSSNVNDTAYVTAYLVSDKTKTAQTKVAFSGVTLLLHADSTNLTPNASTTITAVLVNGSNETVASSHISFTLGKGALSNLSIVSADSITNLSGSAKCVILGKTIGTDSIIVNATGVTKQTLGINVTNTLTKTLQFISILPSRSILKADGKDSCTIAVTLKDTNNNPVVGQCVQFITSSGMIIGTVTGCSGTGQSATDSRGVARASLTSSNVNDTAYVTAYLVSDKTKTAQAKVVFTGVTILLNADSTDLLPGGRTIINALVVNGSNVPIPFSPVSFKLGKGKASNMSILTADSVTGPTGEALCTVKGNLTGTDSVIVVADGATSILNLNVTDLVLNISLDANVLQAQSGNSTALHVTFFNNIGKALSGKYVQLQRSYQTSGGADTADFLYGTTDSSGKCSFIINALSYQCIMTLKATATNTSTDIASAATSISFITTRAFTITALPTVIQADGGSQSTITVVEKNPSNNPIVGDIINFSANAGLITATATTDINGKAVGILTSDRRNTIATVSATSVKDPTKNISVQVSFTGVVLTANTNPPSISSSGKDTAIISITLIDAAKNPIPNEPVNFSKLLDATHILIVDTVTDNRGAATCKVYGTGTGTDTITVVAAGATAKTALNYTSNFLTVKLDSTPVQPCIANGIDSTKFDITFLQGDGITAVQNATLSVSVTLGSLNNNTVFTRTMTLLPANNGKLSFYMKNPTFSNTATVFVYAQTTGTTTQYSSATFYQYFKAAIVKKIILNGTPDVIATNGSQAQITAVAYDSLGNRVANKRISFNIINAPGGGEYLNPPTAITATDGSAITYLVSGTIPSTFRQVGIVAGDSTGIKSDTLKFTFAGPPYAISFSVNILHGIDYNDGTFGLPCAAIVTDINGNPVADGTAVTFSAKITGAVIHKAVASFNNATVGSLCGLSYAIDTAYVIYPFSGDSAVDQGPPYIDINKNGRRDYPGCANYEPPEPYRICYDGSGKPLDTVFADYNGNSLLDSTEPLVGSAIAMTDATYTNMLNAYKAAHGGMGYAPSYLWYDGTSSLPPANGGILQPLTTVSITRTIQTVGGKATNILLYGQEDATKIQVSIWAESQGVITPSPSQFIAPIIGNK